VLALVAGGCSVSAGGEVPCVEDVSCPHDYPVCSAGKCVAGTPSSRASAQIVGVAGKAAGQPVRSTVTVQVAAKSDSGVKSVSLTGGGKTFAPAAGATGPQYDIPVDTTTLADGAVSLTATVTPGDPSVQPASSAAFSITVDNAVPVLTSGATLPPVQLGTLVTLDVTASEALGSINADVLLSGDVIGKATEISAPTGNVHHLGFTVAGNAAVGTYTFRVTATDLAGNGTAAPLQKSFDVPAIPTGTLIADSTNISIGGSANLTATFANGTGVVNAAPPDASLPGTITSATPFVVSPIVDTTYTLVVTNPAGATTTETVTVFVGQTVTVALIGTSANPGQSANLLATVSANAQQAFVEPGHHLVTPGATNQPVSVSADVTTVFTLVATNSAGAEFRATATLTVTQPVIASFSGPDVITTGTGPTLTVKFTPATANVTVPGCAGGTVTGSNPASQTFTCALISTLTTYTATATLGTAAVQATHAVDVAPNPATTSFSFPGPAIDPGAQAHFNGTGCGTGCTVTFSQPMTLETGSFSAGFTARLTTNPTTSTTVSMTVTTTAGVSLTSTATAVVNQPSITSFGGPAVVTSGIGFTLSATFTPGNAIGTVAGCTPNAVTGGGPFQQTFSCSAITTDTSFTLNLALGTISIQPTTAVQVAPNPAVGLAFRASPPVLPFNASNSTTLTVQFCGGSTRCSGTYSVNGSAPIAVTHNGNPTVAQSATTTYTLTVTNLAGSTASSQVTVPTYTSTIATNTMGSARIGASAALLSNGKVLVAGGSTDGTAANAVTSAELFNPATGSWSPVACSCGGACGGTGTPQAALHVARMHAGSTSLSGGTILITGGIGTGGAPLQSVEVYDPVLDCFRSNSTGLQTARDHHTATAYGTNRAAVIGGTVLNTCEVYTPGGAINTGTFANCTGSSSTIDMQVNRAGHTAILLANRYVLVSGGAGDQTADIFDTNTNGAGGFTNLTTNVMQAARTQATATLLAGGKALIAGGGLASAELFTLDASGATPTGATTPAGTMSTSRTAHAAVPLNGGGILMAGGSASQVVDVYDPDANSFGSSFSLSVARPGTTFGFPLLLGGRAVVGGGTATTASAADYIIP